MFNANGTFTPIYSLRGVNPILNDITIPNYQPNKQNILDSLIIGGLIHKKVRQKIQPLIKPDLKLLDLTLLIENETREIAKNHKNLTINNGIGFPAGLSLNECAAHWAPSNNTLTKLKYDDVLKIDFGVEINGWIIDSAFTISFNPKYDILLQAVKEATYHGIKTAGIDVVISDWARGVGEIMESYEINLNGINKKINVIQNLGGHNILNGIIHGGTFLPAKDLGSQISRTNRFKTGVYAIETFGSTGDNITTTEGEPTLFRIDPDYDPKFIKNNNAKTFLQKIKNNFNTLPFCDRYLEKIDVNYKSPLNYLIDNKIVHCYPPLVINNGDYTAQYEHTIYIDDTRKVVCSSGEDY